MASTVPRSLALAGGGLALVLGATACAESEASPSVETVTIQPSSYVTKPVVTTTTAVPGTVAEGTSPVEQLYTVQAGDYPVMIAQRYEVDLEELRNYNDWTDDFSNFPGPGATVKIPPGAIVPEDEPEPSVESTDASGDGGTTVAPQGPCAPGSYVVESGDAPLVITEKFDVTLDALNEANVDTPRWPNLYTGDTIVIPPPEDCDE